MRAYLAITPEELAELLERKEIFIDSAFSPTAAFKKSNPELGQEESDYILSLLAAEDSIEFQNEGAKFSFALAVDLEVSQIGAEEEVEVKLLAPIKFSQVDCLFVGDSSDQDGELTWFAAQEIANNLLQWQGS